MKLNGFVGKGSGKLGASVFAISGGEQIVREYNPNVSNPNTDAQVAQRAKLKLMSQLAAAVSQVLAYKKQGLVSARNQFISRNIGLCTFTEADGAKCDIQQLDLTGGKITLPAVVGTEEAAGWAFSLQAAAASAIKRVLYAVFSVDENDKLVYQASALVTEPGADRKFAVGIDGVPSAGYCFAYGIADNDAAVTSKFEDYLADYQKSEAALAVVSFIKAASNTLSVTKCVKYSNT